LDLVGLSGSQPVCPAFQNLAAGGKRFGIVILTTTINNKESTMIQILSDKPEIGLVASESTWVEGDAVAQLRKTAALEGIERAAGMPDIHPGKAGPVGGVFLSRALFYPHIIGNDAGCGMGFFGTSLKTRKMKKEKWAEALSDWADVSGEEKTGYLEDAGLEPDLHDDALGTIGGGNHFAELQMLEQVADEETFRLLGWDEKTLFLLVHSGSRSLGEGLYRDHTGKLGAGPLRENTDEAGEYMKQYSRAVRWARVNRAVIAERVIRTTGGDVEPLLDLAHNTLSPINTGGETFWLHRKGAAPSDEGLVVIPGSRGALTYLVLPTGEQAANLWSLAHGAGRKWNRGSCKGKLKDKWPVSALKRTDLGGLVVCDDRELIYEEAPQAFKKIDTVIEAMADCGLIRVVASFRPVVTLKAG
jgi:release factor H-coupled RctB family protein